MNQDECFMHLALKEAKKAYKKKEVPVGVVIIKDNKIIAKGYNLRESKQDVTKHAELIAIQRASKKIGGWRLNECVMYVTLYPCPMCASAIAQSRIKKIVIGAPTKDSKIKEIDNLILSKETNTNIDIQEGILVNECSNILNLFFKEQRKKN